jgi:flagellar hook-associated protein 3 FlgL
MMINSTMADIQTNKNQLNTLDTQLSTQKKINRPSDDPIVAIRALRLRTSVNQVTQYLDKNVSDADSWLQTTEGALDEAYSIVTQLYAYCEQGASDSYSSSERNTLADSLNKLKDAFYAEGDVEYAGRYCFTGYMTDTPLNYQSNESAADEDYIITQNFTRDDLDTKKAYTGYYETNDILTATDKGAVTSTDVHRIRLAYDEVNNGFTNYTVDKNNNNAATVASQNSTTSNFKDSNGNAISMQIVITDANGNPTGGTITVKSIDDVATTELEKENYQPKAGEAILNYTTGEILLADDVYEKLYNADGFSYTYEKDNFVKGDQNPVMYFDCINNSVTDGTASYYYGVEYNKVDEDIEYNVNFSQKLKINTEANDAFNINLGRDIDDLVTAVNQVIDIENQISDVENKISQTTDETKLANYNKILERLNKQKDYAEDNMTAAFEKGVGVFQGYQQEISLAKADVGNRMTRLSLTKSRLTEQKTNFTNLKSQNEDIDLEEVVVGYSSAQLVYNASLTAASKVVQQTLLDFL